MVVATYFCYEKVRRTMRTAIVSNLLKLFTWFIVLRKTRQIFRGGYGTPAVIKMKLFVKSWQLEPFKKCWRCFWRDFETGSPSMAAVNRHRKGFAASMSNDHMKVGDDDFTTHCHDPMEADSASIIHNLELLKQAVFIDACGWFKSNCHKMKKFIERKLSSLNFHFC